MAGCGLSNGLAEIVWTCAEGNVPSLRTAKKLGLAREADYTLYFTAFDEAEHLVVQAYHDLESGRYGQAVLSYDQVFGLDQDQPSFICHEAARAWAGAGNGGKALCYLAQAIDRGWVALEETAQCHEFVGLIDTPDWQAALAQASSQAVAWS